MPKNKLMKNYGWVQNTSNLSTIRDTLELVPEHGIKHLELRKEIKKFRLKQGRLPNRWDWDARCRIKAIHATGMVTLNRHIQGYNLTDLGKMLINAPKSNKSYRGIRLLTEEEIYFFKQGLLTNPPVIRVLELLNEDLNTRNIGLSKYDIGMDLGFVGDIGFTHLYPNWIIRHGYSFNNKEGDADKWARTILRWLEQVGWIYSESKDIIGKKLKHYKANPDIESILRYEASKIERNVPAEMLCSNHHPFPKLIQKRRVVILRSLSSEKTLKKIQEILEKENIKCLINEIKFEILNLIKAGLRIIESAGYYKLNDKIYIDAPTFDISYDAKTDKIESDIEKLVIKYEKTIPSKLVDHVIRFSSNKKWHNEFESTIAEYFQFLGYDTEYKGQGKGRVSDVIVKYIHPSVYAKSYGLIIDAKSTSSKYNFPSNDKRKMIEYIRKHGLELMNEGIPNHAFSYISSEFIENVKYHLDEISNETQINGCALEAKMLLFLGHCIKRRKVALENLYSNYSTNNVFNI